MTADAAQRLCPSCREPFERETIAGLPFDMPHELTANDRRKDQRAFVVLCFASTLGALACFFLASQLWPAGSTPWASRASDDTDGELAVYLLYAGFALLASAGGLFFKVLHPHSDWQKEVGPTDEYKGRAGTGPMS